MGRVGGWAVDPWDVASSLECPPVGRGRQAVVGGVMGEVCGVRMRRVRKRGRRGRDGGQVGSQGRGFIRQVQQWRRGKGCLILIENSRVGGGT